MELTWAPPTWKTPLAFPTFPQLWRRVRFTELPVRSLGAGHFCYHFQDSEGRCVVWFSKRKRDLAVGSKIRATFVIYKHSEFNGSKQNLARKFRLKSGEAGS